MARKVLITGATGDTGRAAVKESIALGLEVRAMVHSKDARSEALEKLGAEVVVGDLLEINTIRAAMEGVEAAYLVWPVQPGLIQATVNFAQAAREASVSTIINLSQRSANRYSKSNSCRDTFIAEQVLNWESRSSISARPISSSGCSTRGSCRICSRAFSVFRSARGGTPRSQPTIRAAPLPRS